MPFSKRFIYLIILGSLLELIASIIDYTFTAFVIYNGLILALLIFDYIITPDSKMISVSRKCDRFLSMGTYNTVEIIIENQSKHNLLIEAVDEIPFSFDYKDEVMMLDLNKNTSKIAKYSVFPRKRGEFAFGRLHLRFDGVLGICSKSFKYDIGESYKVYPNIKDLTKYGLKLIRKNSLFEGVKKIKTYQSESEFDTLKEYTKGDDIRKINWNATARMNKLIVNTYEDEKNQQIFIMIDTGRVMNSEINNIKKLDYAINAAFLLADVVIRKGDKVGVLAFDSEVRRFVPVGKGSGHFRMIAERLYNVSENIVSSDYRGALEYLNQRNKKRSLICVFTDLFDIEEAKDLIRSLKLKSNKHIPLVITIKNMTLYSIANKNVENIDDIYTKSTALKMIEERAVIKRLFDVAKIACIDIEPNKLSAEVVNAYLSIKTQI